MCLGVHVNAHLFEKEPERAQGSERCTCCCLCSKNNKNARISAGLGVVLDSNFSARYNYSAKVRE